MYFEATMKTLPLTTYTDPTFVSKAIADVLWFASFEWHRPENQIYGTGQLVYSQMGFVGNNSNNLCSPDQCHIWGKMPEQIIIGYCNAVIFQPCQICITYLVRPFRSEQGPNFFNNFLKTSNINNNKTPRVYTTSHTQHIIHRVRAFVQCFGSLLLHFTHIVHGCFKSNCQLHVFVNYSIAPMQVKQPWRIWVDKKRKSSYVFYGRLPYLPCYLDWYGSIDRHCQIIFLFDYYYFLSLWYGPVVTVYTKWERQMWNVDDICC